MIARIPNAGLESLTEPRLFPRFRSSPMSYGTRNDTLLKSVPLDVTTSTSGCATEKLGQARLASQ
jgi:hypothetical protein